jgi:heme-degrading monooxygenase HmoA
MSERLEAARGRKGWIGGQLVTPVNGPNKRTIIGTWETRADWEAWHHDPAFTETRQKLDGLESAPSEQTWHEVLLELYPAASVS